MSEALLKVFLSELKTIRIICCNKDCGAIVEGDVTEVYKLLSDGQCKFCGQDFRQGGESPISQLVQAINTLGRMGKKVSVEFVLPAKGQGK